MTEADAAGEALAAVEADADPDPEAPGDPLGEVEKLGKGVGDGDGKIFDGTFVSPSANISTKMTITSAIHGRARRSFFGGSAPRYPAAGGPEAAAPRR